ncbi:DUF4124 domain-containing protein [Alteromonas facilis]|uniref:DUF4124 domain-containing protein n=1 Tax=Alteromonas facilis TaxID=2048004 RepID=UPI0013DB24B8|nr:DUF4124 domain-containing protein [Alteromonas facilis]
MTLLLTVGLCATVYARTVYKVVAADGTVTYTDQPVPGSTPVHLNKVNTSQPLARVNSATAPNTAAKTEKPIDYTLTITSPQDEATIRDNNGKFNINAQLTPAAPGGRYQLIFDGQNVGESDTGNFELSNVVRGQHRFKVEYTDNKGKVLASSPSQTLFMHQASALINPKQ